MYYYLSNVLLITFTRYEFWIVVNVRTISTWHSLYEGLNLLFCPVPVRKAYHKLSLIVHPDRVDENKKLEATEKFKVLGHVHSILSDSEKRKIYDETGLHSIFSTAFRY